MDITVKHNGADVTLNDKTPLCAIAAFIGKDWAKVNYAAKPYLEAMMCLNSIHENYGCDSGHSVVAYALSNMSQYKGENAKAIKSLLKHLLKS